MASDIRPVAIGFAFGAVAGIAVGAWYATGMAKLDAQEDSEPADRQDVSDPAAEAAPEPETETKGRETGGTETAELRARVAELEAALVAAEVDAAVGPSHTFDELPDLHSPESIHEEMNGFEEWAKTQPADWGLKLAGLDCDEPPCLIHVEMNDLDSEGSIAAQEALNDHFLSAFEFEALSSVHMNTFGDRTHMVRFFAPGDEALRDDLDRAATLRIRALWEELEPAEE